MTTSPSGPGFFPQVVRQEQSATQRRHDKKSDRNGKLPVRMLQRVQEQHDQSRGSDEAVGERDRF